MADGCESVNTPMNGPGMWKLIVSIVTYPIQSRRASANLKRVMGNCVLA